MTIMSVLSFTLATCSLAITSVLAQSPDSLPPNASRPSSARQNFPGQTEGDFIVKNFNFKNGEVLPELRLHYLTLGHAHRDAAGVVDNAILILHSTGDDGLLFFDPRFSGLFSSGNLFDAAKYYIVIPDAIGHGRSSKPSDGLRAHFPQYEYDDVVAAQHLLVTEKLGISHLVLVLGYSMGGMHAWLWGERYPGMMDALVPLCALPVETGGRNRLWRRIMTESIRSDPEWKNGDYVEQPHGLARMRPLVMMMVQSPVHLYEKYPTRAAADAYYDQLMRQPTADANDRLYQYDASRNYNPAPDLEKIMAKLLAIEFADDQINSPEFSALEREMPRVKNGRYVIVPADSTTNGEWTMMNTRVWRTPVQELLRSVTH